MLASKNKSQFSESVEFVQNKSEVYSTFYESTTFTGVDGTFTRTGYVLAEWGL